MNKKTFLFPLAILLLLLQSCSPRVGTSIMNTSANEISAEEEVLVIEKGGEVPANSRLIGEFEVSNKLFTKECSYLEVLHSAKATAKKYGANLISISELKDPDLSTICYRIKGEMYVNNDTEGLRELRLRNELKNKSRLSGKEDYAMIYFYRPKNYIGSLVGYKLRLGDEVVGKVRNGEKFELKVTDVGKKKFWAKTETKEYLEIEIEKGKEYFVRCDLKWGLLMGRPNISLTENHVGMAEYEEAKKFRKD